MTQHDDNITHKSMPLAGHLIELRNRLLYTVGTIMIMFVLSYLIADDIYRFLAQPLADILADQGRRMIFTGLTEAFLTNITIAFWTPSHKMEYSVCFLDAQVYENTSDRIQ